MEMREKLEIHRLTNRVFHSSYSHKYALSQSRVCIYLKCKGRKKKERTHRQKNKKKKQAQTPSQNVYRMQEATSIIPSQAR
jgi:CRISPR/Cas system-associated protein Cas10 (large subunit of type III CRISPR-Cas system)